MILRGVVGRVEWGYYVAAGIEGYTVSCGDDKQWRLRATVITSDPFKMTRRPLRFVAPHAKGTWTWPIESLRLEGGVLTAALGTPL